MHSGNVENQMNRKIVGNVNERVRLHTITLNNKINV